MISLYVSALLYTLQHIVIHAMQLSCVSSDAHLGLRDGGPVFRAPFCSSGSAVVAQMVTKFCAICGIRRTIQCTCLTLTCST